LVEELSRENSALKNKLETSYFSFKSPDRDMDHTSKRQKFTEDSLNKYSKTCNQVRQGKGRN